MKKLAGKVAIVTGSNRGIGRGIAVEMAKEDAKVTVNYRSHAQEAEEVAQEIRDVGSEALVCQGDVSQRDHVQRMVEATVDTFGRLDIMVCNAYTGKRKPFLELTCEDVAETWDVILWGAFHCSQLAAEQMVKQGEGGCILMISSIHSFIPFRTALAYNVAKAGQNQMANTLASELIAHRIRVNTIEPGWTDTPGERVYTPDEVIREKAKALPWKRLATIEDLGKAAVFLCSDDADYITAAILRVDGGFWLPRFP